MSETRAYQPTDVEAALATWVSASVQEGIPVIFANQGMTRIPRPFVTIQILSDFSVQEPEQKTLDERWPDGTNKVATIEHRSGVVQVTAFGSQSWSIMRDVARSIRRADIIELNTRNGIEIQQAEAIQDIPELLSTGTEPRRIQDFTFAYCDFTIEALGTGVVERVIAEGELSSLEAEIDVGWPETT